MEISLFRMDRPDRAVLVLVDRYSAQYILLTNRSGGLISPPMDIINGVVTDIIKTGSKLMLRGIYHDDKHGNYELHIEHLIDCNTNGFLTVDEIQKIFHHEDCYYSGSFTTVEAYFTKCNFGSDYFCALNNEYYEKIKKAMHW